MRGKGRAHKARRLARQRRFQELVGANQIQAYRLRPGLWRINGRFDYCVSTGRVLDRTDPSQWIQGRVSGPDEMIAVARGGQQLTVERESRRVS